MDPYLEALIRKCPFATKTSPSVLSAPTLMGHFYSLKATLRALRTIRREDVVRAVIPNLASSGHKQACSTSPIAIDIMTLMQCPSVLSAPTLMGHFYSLKTIYRSRHTRLGGEMWCWRPPQINTHQDRVEAVAPPPSTMKRWL